MQQQWMRWSAGDGGGGATARAKVLAQVGRAVLVEV
jgi:hypothetical protein